MAAANTRCKIPGTTSHGQARLRSVQRHPPISEGTATASKITTPKATLGSRSVSTNASQSAQPKTAME